MNRNSQARFKKRYTHRKKRTKPMVIHGDLPSTQPLVARITYDGHVFVATVINGRGSRDFLRLFCDDFDELSWRLRQNGISVQT